MKKISKSKEFRVIILCFILVVALVGFTSILLRVRNNRESSQAVTDEKKLSSDKTPTIKPDNNVFHKPIPILMYHHLRDYNVPSHIIGTKLSVSPTIFDQQMKWLKDQGYSSVSPEEYLSGKYPTKPVIITFDDGYDNAYTVGYKTLKKYAEKGIFYIITNNIGHSDSLNQDQIKEMSANGMIIGSHTVNHIDLSKATDQQVFDQLSESKTVLEKLTGKPVLDFCYPSGQYNQKTIKIEKSLGYQTAMTTKTPRQIDFSDYWQLPRIRIENISLAQFAQKVENVK